MSSSESKMESGDSDSEEDGVEYSGMEQPPLTKMLKNILSEYPDDGQILKELIQNAEDAEATEVRVLLDCRHINNTEVNHRRRPYYKYFRSPALYFYNNAVFTEADWRGIKMLYSSVKELDPLKVGRFGLGFKSVFHITDFPIVVSGDKMLIIDPHQTNPGKVCQTIKLQKLPHCRKMQKDDYMPALNGVFGFNEDTVHNGKYHGTLFRFPLRTVPTELSDNLYTESKLTDLFHTFECEASITMLFLKFLHKLELYICRSDNDMDNSLELRFSVSISGPTADDVIASRYEFSESIKALMGQLPPQSINNVNLVTIKTVRSSNEITETSWIVVNTFHGGSVSQKLCTLSQDEDLSYSPCVGIAAQMDEDPDFKGHVFCFLPLPLEQESLSGLPVHVNGYFALSQNRRHVKWRSADQLGSHGHPDKSMQWNECLVTEVLSQTYVYLIEQLIQKCKDNGNPEHMVSMVYQIIPAGENVDLKWRIIMKPLLENLLHKPVFFTLCHGGKWIRVQDAVFAEFDNEIDSEIQATVRAVVKQYNYDLVDVPCHVWKLVRNNISSPSYLTQEFVRRVLHNSDSYVHCTATQKLHLLEFLVSGGKYRNVDGLELLPLQSGGFLKFGMNKSPVFSCTQNEAQICFSFPDVILKTELSPNVQQMLQCMMMQGICQLKAANESDIAEFIRRTTSQHFCDQQGYMEWNVYTCSVPEKWLENIWKYLEKRSLTAFKHLNIVPCRSANSIALYKLSSMLILESNFYSNISPAISKALRRFSVHVLSNLSSYVTNHPEVMQRFIHPPNSMGVCAVLAEVYNTGNFRERISHFNRHAGADERNGVTRYLESVRLSDSTKTLLWEMEIFKACGSSDFVSIRNVRVIAPNEKIPVRFPRKLISQSAEQMALAKNLGATVLNKYDMMIEIFIKVGENFYYREEVEELMSYFISNINIYKSRSDIMKLAKKIPFVCTCDGSRKMASEVFDPKNKLLKSLLADKSKFPASSYGDHSLKVLRELGMKSENDVTASMVYECAQQLDRKYSRAPLDDNHKKQSESIILFLERNRNMLDVHVEWRTTLKTLLLDLCFIPSLGRPTSYPAVLPWFGDPDTLCSPRELRTGSTKNQRIVGSTMPLVSEKISQIFAKCFGWLDPPPGDEIVSQLREIVSRYKPEYKPDIMPLLKEIYSTLTDLEYIQFPQETECVWTGEGFVEPDKIIVNKCMGDINVEPYMYYLPKEFQTFSNFFLNIGCKDAQTIDILVDVLLMVKDKRSKHSLYPVQHDSIREDLNLIVQILNKLKDHPEDIEGRDIMFPIHTGDDTQLELRSASDCHYSNADWLQIFAEEDNEDIVLVHPNIPHDTAEKLGVKSLTESLFSDAEGMEPWGQNEPLTRRIKNLLRDYKDGFSVPKEIVQNAEDARATKVCFLYDERQNPDWRTKLIDEQMSECQGPALWAYNDAIFTKTDLENITKLSGATKEGDSSKIGKFGLGFCSVYNLTDVPSFVSGNDIVIFDPHLKYLGKSTKTNNPGIKINLKSVKNKKVIQRMKNQFQPFQGVFNCDLTGSSDAYQGTLFRFPLRTSVQAKESDISNTPYTKDEMKKLIKIFMEGAGSLLLFSQNVNEVNFYHLPANEENPQNALLIHSVSRQMFQAIPASLRHFGNVSSQLTVLEDTSVSLQNYKSGKQRSVEERTETGIITITTTTKGLAKQIKNVKEETNMTEWIVAWATGTSESLKMASISTSKGILHLASVAASISIDGNSLTLKPLNSSPLGFYKESHFFCFLPLPIASPLPVHINAAFAVSSDRRGLISKTSDDKYSFQSEWNDALMSDAVPNAYLLLLESLKNFSIDRDDDYLNLWPTVSKQNDKHVSLVQKHFYGKIISRNRAVFKEINEWVHFDDCMFLEPSLLHSEVGGIVLAATKHFVEGEGQKVMCISKSVKESFIDSGYSEELGQKMISKMDFFTQYYFPNIHSEYWNSDDRNKLLWYVLNHMQDSLKDLLTSSECIPTEPRGRLRRPADIVHPHSKFKDLFSVEDERFIQTSFSIGLKAPSHFQKLKDIGTMMEVIPDELVILQAEKIQNISCSKGSWKKTLALLEYLHRSQASCENLLSSVQKIPFLPVLKKSSAWVFPWKADDRKIEPCLPPCQECTDNCTTQNRLYEAPSNLFLPEHMYLIGSEVMLVETKFLPAHYRSSFLAKLGVKGYSQTDIDTEIVCKQLACFCETVDPSELEDPQVQLLRKILNNTYQYLNEVLSNIKRSCLSVPLFMDTIIRCPIILIDKQFVYPHKVAKQLPFVCSPYLFGLPFEWNQYADFIEAIGVKNYFSVDIIVDVVLECQEKWKGNIMKKDDLELLKRLMEVLIESLKRNKMTHEELYSLLKKEQKNELHLPDQKGILIPISNLCIDDNPDVPVSRSMRFVHDIISADVASLLGVRSKKSRKLQDHTKKRKFEQSEKLTTRIKRILSGYPCDDGILKELLQNADDASATEVHIVTDFNEHSTENVFDDKWKALQGPALLVYNDSSFSEKDIEGIQNLGIGSKGDDPTKTGQYGVGFNAVYHLTDAPSFITQGPNVENGETLCVMDPNCLYTSPDDQSEAGVQYLELKDLRDEYKDVFAAYHEKSLLTENGTIFRFPLRTKAMASKSEIGKEISPERVSELLKCFKKSMFQTLLFLKNVRKITISNIASDGVPKSDYTVEAVITEENRRALEEFSHFVKSYGPSSSIEFEVSIAEWKEVLYTVFMKDSNNHKESWLVVQRIGMESSQTISPMITEAYKDGSLGLLPLGGVAIPINLDEDGALLPCKSKRNEHAAFCFLPLPLITGLPFHVNGHFALDHETRRNLWQDKVENYRSQWNKTLLAEIVCPAFVSGICAIKHNIQEFKNRHTFSLHSYLEIFNAYHSLFPNFDKAKEDYWRELTSYIFQRIVRTEQELFPSVKCTVSENTSTVELTFFPIRRGSDNFQSVYFSKTESSLTPSVLRFDERPLEKVLKRLGLPILNSPIWIFESMQKSEVKMQALTPDYLIKFLKSYNLEGDRYICRITLQENGTKLEDTEFKSLPDLIKVLEFCQESDNFSTEMYGLPLCLTQDSKLREFSKDRITFCTSFSMVFPKSPHLFLHEKLLPHFQLNAEDLFHQFNIDKLINYLPENLPMEKYATGTWVQYVGSAVEIPNKKWLEELWKFVDQYKIKDNDGRSINRTATKDLLCSKLGSWSLIPCKKNKQSRQNLIEQQYILFPMHHIGKILQADTFTGNLETAIKKLQLPFIDLVALPAGTVLTKIIPEHKYPLEVLECLYQHRHDIANLHLENEDCKNILTYISDNMKQILQLGHEHQIVDKLKSLKLHITIHGERITLNGHWRGLVLPSGIPAVGINTWAEKAHLILIQQSESLKNIYETLHYSVSNSIEVYTQHILPSFHLLPREHYVHHLTYIREVLLCQYNPNYDEHQNHLIGVLKNVKFLDKGDGVLKTASDFCSPHIKIFKLMCSECQMPPKPYCNYEWKHFMELIGLKARVTEDMFITFAHTVENLGLRGITEEVVTLSDHLMMELENQLLAAQLQHGIILSKSFLENVSSIRFVVPYRVTGYQSQIHSQFEEGRLVSFSQSTLSKHVDLAWTSCTLLPEFVPDILLEKLKHLSEPSVTMVIKHLQNISVELKTKCKDFPVDILIDLLSNLFKYISKRQTDQQELVTKLGKMPILFLPKYKQMVTCDSIIIGLDESCVIRPYLFQAPEEFGRYFDLFMKLGTCRKTSCATYARVLHNMHTDIQNNKFHDNEGKKIALAVDRLFCHLRCWNKLTPVDLGVEKLFLPTKEHYLVDSKQLIFSDNYFIEQGMKDLSELSYFLGFREMGLDEDYMDKKLISSLPDQNRPYLLSTMVKEVLTFEDDSSGAEQASRLQEFLNTREFVEGFLRLVMDDSKKETISSGINVHEIEAHLGHICVIPVTELKINYIFNGEVIGGRHVKSRFREEKLSDNKIWKFYAEFTQEHDWIKKLSYNLTHLLSHCTGYWFHSYSGMLVLKLLEKVHEPSKIMGLLDDAGVSMYACREKQYTYSVFEKLGQFVEPYWHHMLDNCFCEFEIGEYVAVMVEFDDEDDNNDDDNVYIYAKIKEKLGSDEMGEVEGLRTRYNVLIDFGVMETKYAYELYKFHRKVSVSSEIMPAVNVDDSKPRKDNRCNEAIFRDIRRKLIAVWQLQEKERNRIIRRLSRQWHPDKNLGNEKQAEEVFKYIQYIVSRLDRGQRVDLDEDPFDSDTYAQPESSAYSGFFNNVNRRCNNERQHYEQYSQSQGHGGRHHSEENRQEPVPHPREARRWMKQARHDIAAAKQFFTSADDVKAYNWICYTCHQGAEKALTALMYSRDANSVRKQGHDLKLYSCCVGTDLRRLCDEMENLIGRYRAMRYPHNECIPADVYSRQMAEEGIKLCVQILEKAEEQL